MGIEAATEMITESLDMNRDAYPKVDRNSSDLKELLTVQCHNSLFESYTSILSGGNKIDLIKIPKEDIFYAWIEKLVGKNYWHSFQIREETQIILGISKTRWVFKKQFLNSSGSLWHDKYDCVHFIISKLR